MISMIQIGSAGGAANYHDKSFNHEGAGRADNYYLNEQAAAHWEGAGAEILGVAGKAVTREEFIDALEGRLHNPATGELQDLSKWAAGERRAGLDLTVAPPKSVSVVALVGGDERIVAAHQAANTRAMQWLEQHASVVRVYSDGAPVHEQKGNLLYATVLHETDRAHQPQLHNHNVIAAAVYDKEGGKWRSLTNDSVLVLRAQTDIVYKSELAKGLRAAGYELDYNKNGVDFEIRGFNENQVQAFAVRSEQINKALLARGIDPESAGFQARQAATVDSRAPKTELPRAEMQELWRSTAKEAGLDLVSMVATARERTQSLTIEASSASEARALKAVAFAVSHLAEREQQFRVTDVVTQALRLDPLTSVGDVERAIEAHRSASLLVDRAPDRSAALMLTTPAAITAERTTIGSIDRGRGAGNVVLHGAADFNAALAAFESRRSQELGKSFVLSDEQRASARNLLMHSDTYQGIQGDAGTGKTAALAMVKDAAESKGWQVLGIATSAAAAKELQASSGIPSQTVASFFVDRANATRSAEVRIAELKEQLERRSNESASIERRAMSVGSGETTFERGTYFFDNKKGEVLKSSSSLVNLVGNFLLDSASQGRAAQDRAGTDSVVSRVRSGVQDTRIAVSEYLGRQLTSYERVGLVEATLARAELLAQRGLVETPLRTELAKKVAEVANLERTGTSDGRKTLLVMDEATLTGAKDTSEIAKLADAIGARVVFQGDVKQHGSVAAGRMFFQAQQAGMHTSTLTQTRRFDSAAPQLKRALELFKSSQFGEGLAQLDAVQVSGDDLAKTVADRYVQHHSELRAQGIAEPSVGIVTLTNKDRKAVNSAVHDALVRTGAVGADGHSKVHLDDPKLTAAEQSQTSQLRLAGVDRLVFRQAYREIGVTANDMLKVERLDTDRNLVIARNARGKRIEINPMKQERFQPAREETRVYSAGDSIEARANIKFAEKHIARVDNGSRGKIEHVDAKGASVRWQDGRTTSLNNDQLMYVDHAYAHTTYKEQGQTTDREILAVSATGANVINRESSYVAGTRARENVEIVTSDLTKMLANADRDASKTMALEEPSLRRVKPSDLEVRLPKAAERVQSVVPELDKRVDAVQDQGMSL